MLEYQILTAETPVELVSMVESYIKDGWVPHGGLACGATDDEWIVMQCVTRDLAFHVKLGQPPIAPKEREVLGAP